MNKSKRKQDHFRGCLMGGAIGDALGWPIEFSSLEEVKIRYGTKGIQDLVINRKGVAEVTDDTQLTLFTAAGIISDDPTGVYQSYLCWLNTQGYKENMQLKTSFSWLANVPEMHVRRAPGITILKSLRSQVCGSVGSPINDSKGCGGVMRVAPAGLYYSPDVAFEKGMEFASITHGHPLGYMSAGAFSYLIANIMEGEVLDSAVQKTMKKVANYQGIKECCKKLNLAYQYSKTDTDPEEVLADLGLGWVGEEALAIAFYCSLKFRDDIQSALLVAVNHDGDSDSTGSMTGNILGAYHGNSMLPSNWIEKIELRDVIIQIADELWMKYKEKEDRPSESFMHKK